MMKLKLKEPKIHQLHLKNFLMAKTQPIPSILLIMVKIMEMDMDVVRTINSQETIMVMMIDDQVLILIDIMMEIHMAKVIRELINRIINMVTTINIIEVTSFQTLVTMVIRDHHKVMVEMINGTTKTFHNSTIRMENLAILQTSLILSMTPKSMPLITTTITVKLVDQITIRMDRIKTFHQKTKLLTLILTET